MLHKREGGFDRIGELTEGIGFDQKIAGAHGLAPADLIRVAGRADHNDRDMIVLGPAFYFQQRFHTIHSGHIEIEENSDRHPVGLIAEKPKQLFAVAKKYRFQIGIVFAERGAEEQLIIAVVFSY